MSPEIQDAEPEAQVNILPHIPQHPEHRRLLRPDNLRAMPGKAAGPATGEKDAEEEPGGVLHQTSPTRSPQEGHAGAEEAGHEGGDLGVDGRHELRGAVRAPAPADAGRQHQAHHPRPHLQGIQDQEQGHQEGQGGAGEVEALARVGNRRLQRKGLQI